MNMVSGTYNLFENTVLYCTFIVMRDECKWWQFSRRRIMQDQADSCYALMAGEIRTFNSIK